MSLYYKWTGLVNLRVIESIYLLFGEQMKQKFISIAYTPADNINTCSLLKLEPPPDVAGLKYTCEWLSIRNKNINGQNSNILNWDNRAIQSSSSEYQCSPMDYGTTILGRVSLFKDNAKIPVKQIKFGPIEAEHGLHEFYLQEARHNIKIVVNKTGLISGELKIVSLPNRGTKNYSLKMLLEADKLKFEFEVHHDSKWLSLLKLYPKQDTSLGLSIQEHYSLFLQKLKQINVFTHFGYFIKVYFASRQYRDIFIYELMEHLGLIGPEYRSRDSDIFKINVLEQKYNESKNQSSQLSSRRLTNPQRTSQTLQVNNQINDEFYNLMYDGETQQQSMNKRKLSFNIEDAQFLFASIRKSDENRQAMQKIRSLANENYNQKKQAKLKIDYSGKTQYKEEEGDRSRRSISISKDHSESSLKKKREQSPGFRQTLELIKQVTIPRKQKQDELKSAIAKLTSQIQNLMKQNRKLSKQNKKLKDQNMRWRLKQIKTNFTKTIKSKIQSHPSEKSIILPSDSKIYQKVENQSQRKLRAMLGLGYQKNLQSSRIFESKSKIFDKQARCLSKDIASIRQTNASTLASNQFYKDETTVSPSKFGDKKFFPTRNISIKLQKKKPVPTRRETQEPDTPSFNPVTENRNYYEQQVKTYQSQFFRQYFNQ